MTTAAALQGRTETDSQRRAPTAARRAERASCKEAARGGEGGPCRNPQAPRRLARPPHRRAPAGARVPSPGEVRFAQRGGSTRSGGVKGTAQKTRPLRGGRGEG
eukprot:TRINITY_DN8992_c0_g1_i1.p6 TRINITY_DN8992_c0_g1~~TRINITY_DN8992_c0_g1_i1.p6  ORF type:complete len:104 (-),score=3.35 TRINITY_DN8992_c0_g1_i1:778-1089(-)